MGIADGFSRTTNGKRIGVFAMQHGPGSENAFPGAAQAFSDNVPILLLPGGEPDSKDYVSPNFSAFDNYGNVTKWMAKFNRVERIPLLMRRAFYQLRTGKGGPVLLETPRNIWDADLDDVDYTPPTGNKVAPAAADVGPSRRCPASGQKPDHPRGAGMSLRRSLGRVAGSRRASSGPGHDDHAWQERLPRGPPAGPGRSLWGNDRRGVALPREGGPRLLHRVQPHAVELRRGHPAGQDVGPLQRRPR